MGDAPLSLGLQESEPLSPLGRLHRHQPVVQAIEVLDDGFSIKSTPNGSIFILMKRDTQEIIGNLKAKMMLATKGFELMLLASAAGASPPQRI